MKKQCPSCNAACTPAELRANRHADRTVALLEQERDAASKRYFESLLNVSGSNLPNDDVDGADGAGKKSKPSKLSPVEALFHQHMKQVQLCCHLIVLFFV